MFRQSTNDRMEAHAMLYVRVDLHRKRSVVAALNDQGELMLSPAHREPPRGLPARLWRARAIVTERGLRGHIRLVLVRRSARRRRDRGAHGASLSDEGDLRRAGEERQR